MSDSSLQPFEETVENTASFTEALYSFCTFTDPVDGGSIWVNHLVIASTPMSVIVGLKSENSHVVFTDWKRKKIFWLPDHF